MAAYFLDSSAIAKRYVTETGSAWVTALIKQSTTHRVQVARLCGVEVLAAIARRVHVGSLSVDAGRAAISQFRADFEQMQGIFEITPALIANAMDLSEKYSLRAYDAVQLASALAISQATTALGSRLILVSADDELNAAAMAEGLAVENPNLHP